MSPNFLDSKYEVIKMGFEERSGGFGGRSNFGPREMHKATCADCGKECEVPFKPIEGKAVYCRDCYQKHKKF
jgi:CxxC-x17-CxxC domain-containing protein